MSEKEGILSSTRARLRAILPEHWRGMAGARFRKAMRVIANFTEQRIRPIERIEEAPDLAWNAVQGAANEKHSRALVNFADEEQKKISSELARRTLDDKARQERATAEKLESEARLSRLKEIESRIAVLEKLRKLAVAPIRHENGDMTFIKVSPDYEWDDLVDVVLGRADMDLVEMINPVTESGLVKAQTQKETTEKKTSRQKSKKNKK